MPVSLKMVQTRSVVSNQYRVSTSIVTSSNIVKEVFVKRANTHVFDRVAVVDDMLHLPNAESPDFGYFRDSAFESDFPDVTYANIFSTSISDRLDSLVEEYDKAVSLFIGSEVSIHSS